MNQRRCKVSGNPCGSDTWPLLAPCKCVECQAFISESHAEACRITAEATKLAEMLGLELKTTRAIVDHAQVAANCWGGIDGCVLMKSGKEWAKALDDLRAALATYVDPE